MILRLPFLGLIRFEPLRDLRRIYLWLTAPKSSRALAAQTYSFAVEEIRSLKDGDLLLGIYNGLGSHPERVIEADRRGIPVGLKPPQWVRLIGAMPPTERELAEKMFRPYRWENA